MAKKTAKSVVKAASRPARREAPSKRRAAPAERRSRGPASARTVEVAPPARSAPGRTAGKRLRAPDLDTSGEMPALRETDPGPPRSRAEPALGKYVYCIIEAKKPLRFGRLGIGAEPAEVHTVNYGDIAAVVSDTPILVYDPTRENVLAHERVNEAVMGKHTVIPMSFGTVFKTNEDIVELLRSAYDAFRDVLVKMKDKLEFGLKVLWDRDQIVRELENDDENLRRLRSEISSAKGSTYFARMQYGRLVDAALQQRTERYVTEIFAALRDVSVASRVNKPIGDRMILNAAFLVARSKESDFDERLKSIGARYDKLTFKYTGPWPPYNFVNIRLKLERAKEAE